MHVAYFVQYFNRPDEPGGSRAYQFARAWTRAGHRVTVVSGAVNHKTLAVPARYRRRGWVVEHEDGLRIVRCWSYAGIRGSFRKRLLNFGSYAATAALAGLALRPRPDVVYASSTPLTVGLPGWITAAARRVPFVFELRDLWPESAVVAGVLDPRSRATRAANALAGFLYRRAARCVAVTQGIADGLVAAGVPRDKVLFVPNGVDDWMVEDVLPLPAPEDGRFRVVYAGAHGTWNGLGQVLDAAALLRARGDVEFVFIGDGDDRPRLVARAKELDLGNVRFLGALPKRETFEHLRRAGATIVVTWDHAFQQMVLANKIFDYLAAERPVVVAARGEMADLVERARCGVVVPPGAPERLAGAIAALADLGPAERAAMGARGREYILARYQRRDLASRLMAEFDRLVVTG